MQINRDLQKTLPETAKKGKKKVSRLSGPFRKQICGPWCNDSTAVCGTAGSGLIPGVPPRCLIGVMAAPQSSKLSVRVQIPYETPKRADKP